MNVSIRGREAAEGLEVLAAGFVQAVNLAGRAAVADTTKAARGTTHWKDRSGETRASIVGEWRGVSQGGFVRAGGASLFLENGTRAHEIVAHGRALRFVVNGQVFFRKMVRHPGTRGTHFMGEAREIGEAALHFYAERFVGAAIQRSR